MSVPVFFVADLALDATSLHIDGDEGRHAATVKRLRIGEEIDVSDGVGVRARAIVSAVGKDFVTVDVLAISQEDSPQVSFSCAQALAKGDRADLAIEILTEVGISDIIPWTAAHSIAKWDENKSRAKWQRTAKEASKQSRRSYIPRIHDVHSTQDICNLSDSFDVTIVLHEDGTVDLSTIELPKVGSVMIVVGPEGGISSTEIYSFEQSGAVIARIGPTVLRTSTAGAIALGILASTTSQWRSATGSTS